MVLIKTDTFILFTDVPPISTVTDDWDDDIDGDGSYKEEKHDNTKEAPLYDNMDEVFGPALDEDISSSKEDEGIHTAREASICKTLSMSPKPAPKIFELSKSERKM